VSWLGALHRARGGLVADLLLYALSAGFAAYTAEASTLPPHRAWGRIALWGYAGAALVVLVQLAVRRLAGVAARAWVVAVTFLATALLPLMVEAVQRAGGRTDRAQDEVVVVEDAGRRLLAGGTPYLDRGAIAALPADGRLRGYVPYQPGMALFGVPRAAAGVAWWTDARV
jgi:hypothetical protein